MDDEEFIPRDPNQEKLNQFFGGDLQENPSNDLLNRMEVFIENHCQNLHEMQDNFVDHNVNDSWESKDDYLSITVSPYENVNNPVFLVEDRTDNPVFNKTTTVFSALSQEMIQLRMEAKKTFYDPLTMFGAIPIDPKETFEQEIIEYDIKYDDEFESKANGACNGHQRRKIKLKESVEIQMGRFLPFLQQLSNFVLRINAVIKNSMEQMAYLYHPKQKLYICTFKNVSMDYVLSRLSQTLSILLTLDAIINDNSEIRDAWENYKKMIGYIRKTPESMGFTSDALNDFQHQIMTLEEVIMNGKMYHNCIHQKYGVFSKVPSHLSLQYSQIVKQSMAKEDELKLTKSMIQQMRIVSSNRALFAEIDRYLKQVKRRVKNELKNGEYHHRQSVVDMFALYGLSNRIFNYSVPQNKKFYKEIWSIQKDIPLVHLTGRAVWYLADFMREHIKYIGKTLDPPFHKIKQSRISFLKKLDDTFNTQVDYYYMEMCQWLIKWDTDLPQSSEINDVQQTLKVETRLLIDGLILATRINNLLTICLWLHMDLGVNFRKSNLRSLTVLAELLKAIEDAFHRRSKRLSADVSYMLTVISFALQRYFITLKTNLDHEKKLSSAKLDCLASLKLCIDLLSTAPTLSRMIVINVAAAVATMRTLMKKTDTDEIGYQLWKLDLVSGWQSYLKSVTDCSFFYWALDFIPLILKDIFDHTSQVYRLPSVFSYLNDSVSMLKCVQHEYNSDRIFNVYKEDISRFLSDEIIHPLCQNIENDLRLHVMDLMEEKFRQRSQGMFGLSSSSMSAALTSIDAKTAMAMASANNTNNKQTNKSFVDSFGVKKKMSKKQHLQHLEEQLKLSSKDLRKFCLLKPFRMLDELIDIKKQVEFYIDRTFYNMATVALHAWEVYAEMRSLAKAKFNLDLIETHIPAQSHFSEGLDVLEIMRNIHVFVAKYTYNLNSQIFIERAFDQLHLNTINVQHVANSIRTHGPGIMPTTVNFAFQFCVSKFQIFNEFLYDDHVKSRLFRDMRYFRDNKKQLKNRYPYRQAKKFNLFMRNLGENERGRSFIDHFRTLITQIGNALGYVRMVRSGGLQYTSQAIQYVPDLENISIFVDQVADAALAPQTMAAAVNLDTVLHRLSNSFAEGMDYFNMLVVSFQQMISSAEHGHLNNFSFILPALTLNFVESMIRKKDRINRKANKLDEASFTDDGFALGCCFLLRVLDLYSDFNALHWWQEVRHHVRKHESELQKQKKNIQNGTEDDEEGWNLSYKRCTQLADEWDLLFFGFQASRIFFRSDDDLVRKNEVEGEGEDRKEAEGAQNEEQKQYENNEEVNNNNNNGNVPPSVAKNEGNGGNNNTPGMDTIEEESDNKDDGLGF